MLASLTGVAKRLAGTMPTDDVFKDNGADLFLALLEERFGGTPATSSGRAFEALRTCFRRDKPIEDYLNMFDEAVAQCTDAGLTVDTTMQAHLLLNQAALTDL